MKVRMRGVFAALCGAAAMLVLVAAAPDGFRMGRGMEILVNMFREVSLFYVDEVDADELLENAAAGMTSGLDPYTEFISAENMTAFQQMTTGKYGGVGSVIRAKGEWVVFSEPYEGSPADKAGIRIGDKILEIAGRDARGIGVATVSGLLKGDPGTVIKLKIEKFAAGTIEEVEVRREIISLPAVPYYGMVSDTVGYIFHSEFTEDSADDMRTAVMSLREQGARALILDYRNNGGGIVQEAVKILSFFVPRGTTVTSMRGRSQASSAEFKTESEPLDGQIPLVVLINSNTASAAEIVAGAIQDLDRGVVMGRRSFGKGLIQSTRPVGYNSYLKLTTAKYYLPSGRCVQAIDYARRGEDGAITYIPDSLISQFTTRDGRKVYDGGGVMPDVKLPSEWVSAFAYTVYGRGYVDDFVDEFMRANPDRAVVPAEFALTDADYAAFAAFMRGKEVEWESQTRTALERLRSAAESERYLDIIKPQLDSIASRIENDVESNLALYRNEMEDLIENDIVLRRAYSRGVMAHNLTKDTDVHAATALLGDRARYTHILSSQDTERK